MLTKQIIRLRASVTNSKISMKAKDVRKDGRSNLVILYL